MGVSACADLLRVSERTIRGWESGATRIPYAAYKLLRVLKGGRYLAHPAWKDYVVLGDTLVTPEGHPFHAGGMAWWSLLVRQARAFGQRAGIRQAAGVGSSIDAGGEVPRPDVLAIGPVDQASRLPPSNRGVSEFRNHENGPLVSVVHSDGLSQPIALAEAEVAQVALRGARGLRARQRAGGAA